MILPPPPPRAGQYRTIYVDSPWPEYGGGKIRRGANRHYPLMKIKDIYALPVGEWAAPDAHCYSWVTNNYLPYGLEALRRWGFRYVTKIDWFKSGLDDESLLKVQGALDGLESDRVIRAVSDSSDRVIRAVSDSSDRVIRAVSDSVDDVVQAVAGSVDDVADQLLQMGLGQYFRGVTESCLFGVRGRCEYRHLPDGKRAQGRTGFHARRTSEHSEKPEKMAQMIELVSHGPRLEMFARSGRAGWDSWGDQAPTMVAVCSNCSTPKVDPDQGHPGVCVCGGYITDREAHVQD